MKYITITLDGPAGSGKSSTAKLLAEKLGYFDINAGSLYRAIGVYFYEKNKDIDNISETDASEIALYFNNDGLVFINGVEYAEKIHTSLAGELASKIGKQKVVRDFVQDTIRKKLQTGNYILQGRDMGRIFSDFAQVKIFLTADPAVRAHRRWLELQKKGDTTTEEEILTQIIERDHRDMTREISPLKKSPDAYEVDTSHITIPEQVEQIYQIVQNKLRTED